MIYYAENNILGRKYAGNIQIFRLFGHFGAINESGTKSILGFSYPSAEEVIKTLEESRFTLTPISINVDTDGKHIVCINGIYHLLDDDGNFIKSNVSTSPIHF